MTALWIVLAILGGIVVGAALMYWLAYNSTPPVMVIRARLGPAR